MTGRPAHRAMEMNGRSTVSYLVCAPRVPFFMLVLMGLETTKNRLAFQGRRGIASVVRWNPRPVVFGVDKIPVFQFTVCTSWFARPSAIDGYVNLFGI